jgi:hypothetical protein
MGEKDRGIVWRLYGFHRAHVVWQLRRHLCVCRAHEEPRDNLQRKCQHNQVASFLALGYSWRAVFLVTYAVEFLFLSGANNTIDGVVFVTCVLQAAFSALYALAFQVTDTVTESCPGVCDKSSGDNGWAHDCACIVAGCS